MQCTDGQLEPLLPHRPPRSRPGTCAGCGILSTLLIRLASGPRAGQRLCPQCAPSLAKGR
jgi:hypothetical protein